MKQNTFETRQRVELLLKEAIAIWQQSDKAEYLEGLETDTVFRMLLNAIAYQANEFDADIERIKDDILSEFQSMVTVAEAGKAIPATIAVETAPDNRLSEVRVDSDNTFFLANDKKAFPFLPVISTRVISASVEAVSRLDSRRWLVSLRLAHGVRNLSGVTFSISGGGFHGLRVNMVNDGREVPLISPWDYANMPMSRAFSLDTLLYNRSQGVSAANSRMSMMPYCMYSAADLFARQDVSLFVIDEMEDFEATDMLELMFEFDGIGDRFNMDTDSLHFNVVLLANASIGTATVGTSSPVARITGHEQFLHLLRPSEEQLYGALPLEVRRVNGDRFNRGRLAKLLYSLIAKYDSDYYAFQEFGSTTVEKTIRGLRKGLHSLMRAMEGKGDRSFEGVYLMVAERGRQVMTDFSGNPAEISLSVEYVTTSGAAVNVLRDVPLRVTAPDALDSGRTVAVSKLQSGFDEVYDEKAVRMENRYFLSTEDRIVTPADVKLFCYKELMVHFGLVRDMVRDIRISHRQRDVGTFHTYETLVTVCIVDNVFTRQAFEGRIPDVESFLGRMIRVRTNGIYPVCVTMKLV